MNKPVRTILYWLPRILTMLFAIFISLFALDVFGKGHGFWQTLLALFMHLIPTFILFVLLAFAWRWEWIGAVFFTALGGLYIFWSTGRFPLSTYFIMSGPLFLVGILFLLNWLYRKEIKTS